MGGTEMSVGAWTPGLALAGHPDFSSTHACLTRVGSKTTRPKTISARLPLEASSFISTKSPLALPTSPVLLNHSSYCARILPKAYPGIRLCSHKNALNHIQSIARSSSSRFEAYVRESRTSVSSLSSCIGVLSRQEQQRHELLLRSALDLFV